MRPFLSRRRQANPFRAGGQGRRHKALEVEPGARHKPPPSYLRNKTPNMKIGFIGLGNVGGNVGGKLAGSLLRNGFDLTVRDLDPAAVRPLVEQGARTAASPAEMAASCDIVITCLPSPAASRAVLEAEDGVLAGLTAGTIWAEMSTTDEAEVRRLGALVRAKGGDPAGTRSRAGALAI